MIDFVLQKPWHVGIGGGMATAVAVYVALRTQHRLAWRVAQLLAVASVGLVVLSVTIETEEETIRQSLYAAARAIERGDIDAVVDYIHPENAALRRRARAEFELYKIERVAIKSNLMVSIDRTKNPPVATATFNVVVRGSDSGSLIGNRNVPRYVVLKYKPYHGEWKVTGFEHYDPLKSMRKEDGREWPQFPLE